MNNKQVRNSRKLKRKTNRRSKKNKKSRLNKNIKYISGGGFFSSLKNLWMKVQNARRAEMLEVERRGLKYKLNELEDGLNNLRNGGISQGGKRSKKSVRKSNKSSKTNQAKLNKEIEEWQKKTDKMFDNFKKEKERKKKSKNIDHLTRYVGFLSG